MTSKGKKGDVSRKASAEFDDFYFGGDDFGFKDDISLDAPPEAGSPDDGDFTKIDIEKVAQDETDDLLSGFKDRAARENERRETATDTEFWIALCFQTREQKEEFLHKIGWDDLGDKYLDGMACADAVGIELKSYIPPMPTLRLDAKLMSLARDLGNALTGKKKKRRMIVVDDD